MAADVHELLVSLDADDAVSMVGYDIGAGVAYAYAEHHRDSTARLGFVEFALPGFGFEQAAAPAPDHENWQLGFFASAPDVACRLFTGREDDLVAWYFAHAADDPDAVSAADQRRYADILRRPGTLRAMTSYFAAAWQDAEDNRSSARTPLRLPVLAVGGSRSAGTGPGQSMASVAEDVRTEVVENAGHWLVHEQPEAFLALLRDFL